MKIRGEIETEGGNTVLPILVALSLEFRRASKIPFQSTLSSQEAVYILPLKPYLQFRNRTNGLYI